MRPDVWIPAVSGLVGALIGGACTIWAATRQFNLQAQKEHRQRHEQLVRRYDSFRLRIGSMKRLDAGVRAECSKLALDMRAFFIENADQLRKSENQEFYDEYLAEATNPSDAYWTDERWLGFVTDGERLLPSD
jgi:hypothetical protein